MIEEPSLLTATTDVSEISLYRTLKKICQKYTEKIPGSDKSEVKKMLFKSYGILLNKVDSNYKAIPADWSDEDILNALYLHICELTDDERAKQVFKKFCILYENQNTAVYENSVGPVLKMLYSIAMNEISPAQKKKYNRLNKNNWFDTEVVSESLCNFKKYLPIEDMKFFSLPKMHSSQSDSNLSLLRPFQLTPVLTFDCNFKKENVKQEKLSFDLDEGFVTPNEEHKERSPCLDKKINIPSTKSAKGFDWDTKLVGVPPRKDKTWEKLSLYGRNKEHPFVPRQVHLQHWLSKAPHSVTKISRNQLMEDLMSLLIGVPSTTFLFNGKSFVCKTGVFTDQHTVEDVLKITKQYTEAAEAFLDLKNLAEKNLSDDIITRAFKLALKKYLYHYQLIIYHIINGRSNNKASLNDVQSLIEQVIYLKKILVRPEELRGVALLEQLFSHMETSSAQMFYLLTSLFLQPCLYYFRLIDDWIFLGKWHKDLPISPSDFSAIQDRQSWEEAYKPIQCNFFWFIPVQDLAYCGKALSLLSLSKNSEKFLKMLKSDDKLRVKVCLNLGELKKLQTECDDFYKRAKISFQPQKEEKLDLISCAHDSAKMKAQTFEELIKEKMDYEKERKRKELNLREEDLIRSAKVKYLKKQEEEFDNMRVIKELEDMLLKEEKREFEKAKEIFNILKQEQAEEEKKEFIAEWKLKRHKNNKKRQEFFNDIFQSDNLVDINGSNEVVVAEKHEIVQDCNNDSTQILIKSNILDNSQNNLEEQDKVIDLNEVEHKVDTACDLIKHSEFEENRLKVLSSNIIVGDIPTIISENESEKNDTISSSKILSFMDSTAKNEDTKYTQLKENRLKVLGSNLVISDVTISRSEEADKNFDKVPYLSKVSTLVETSSAKDDKKKCSELVDIRSKVLGSSSIFGDNGTISTLEKDAKISCPSKTQNLVENITDNDNNTKHSDLEINRMKALHSDFERGNQASLLVYQHEAGKNKEKILGSHFTLGPVVDNSRTEIPQINENIYKDEISKNEIKSCSNEEMSDTNAFKENANRNPLDSEDLRQVNIIKIGDSSKTNVLPVDDEQRSLPSDKVSDKSEPTSEHIGVNGVSWFQKCNQHAEGVKDLFKSIDLVNLPEQRLDYYSILRCVPGSLNLVLETQLKLVNEALLEMFLNEYQLLTEAGKLKKFFFLDEEFGKRLTCSLCPAIEKEKPLTLLTFGRLRDVLAFASQGDNKLSFIVKETPTAFEHTNPQALSCLGLSYKYTWPLNLIFTDIAMSKYNDVFEYMLSLQRVSWNLDQVWLLLKFRSSQMNGHEYTQIQLYRHIMSQFVCSLQWYICTTVIENCWQKFNREIKEVTNIQEMYRKHAAYLKEVIFKCFLNEKSSGLMKRMQSLLKSVLIFCQVMRFGEWSISETGDYQHCNFTKLQNTFSSFLKLARYIVRQIEKLVKVNYQEGLVNLYNLLTLNSFYLT